MKIILTEAEEKMATLIWNHEPIKSSDLVTLCELTFNWKKSTTYTMLKKLEDKQVFINDNSIVKSRITQEDFYAHQSAVFVDENFNGSLPKFLNAFTRKQKLSAKDIKELQKLIDDHQGDS